ncbi:MAG: hypothetical protein JXX14_26090 [Deltaproteobacteria bacterium]|nr:hypothetical protein [Deltaproteobacteria bacterium]
MKQKQKLRLLGLLTLLCAGLAPAYSWAAAISTCIEVNSQTSLQSTSLQKLVETELARFPSHQMAAENCITTLHVETFPFAENKYITLRMSGEVPVRFGYSDTDDLVQKIQKGLRLVLGNDPVYLKDNISQYSESQRALNSLKVQGTARFRMEIFESITRTGQGPTYGPGLAAAIYKGSKELFIFSRIHASMALPTQEDVRLYRPLEVGLDAGFNFELNKTRPVAGYIGGGIGVAFLRFEGVVSSTHETTNELLIQAFARAGVRFFRLTAFDMDLFAAAYLPFHPVSDVDTTLLGTHGRAYTPQLQLGIGVGF